MAPWVVMAGLWGAILSSAIGSILSAPRTLQALAGDRLAPAALGAVHPESGEPVLALRLSGGLALLFVLLGDLNAVATVATMFFLTTYGTLNLVACLEEIIRDPSYRPRIRIPWWLAFTGFVGCVVAMGAINPWACILAVAAELVLYGVLRRHAITATWGDLRNGMWFAAARFASLQLRDARLDPRNWRPHILVLTRDVARSVPMIKMAANFSQNRGIVTVSTLMLGDLEDLHEVAEHNRHNQQLLETNGVVAFCEVASVTDFDAGAVTVAQANGFGGFTSNMVMLGWPQSGSAADLGRLLSLVRKLDRIEKSTTIVRPVPGSRARGSGTIHVWWKGKESNGDLMLLLGHLLTLADGWRRARLALKSVVTDAEEASKLESEFAALLPDIRIEADVDVLVRPPEESFAEVIRRTSQDADLIFVGLPVVPAGEEEAYAANLIDLLEGLPSTILVRNSGPFRGRLV